MNAYLNELQEGITNDNVVAFSSKVMGSACLNYKGYLFKRNFMKIKKDIIFEGIASKTVNAVIDTGASYTLLPKKIADEIGVRYTGERLKLGGAFLGLSDNTYIAVANIKFPLFNNLTYSSRIAVSERAKHTLIGMDVLNPLKIVIDTRTGELVIKNGLVELAKGGLMVVGAGVVAYGLFKLFFGNDKDED